jgi:hypothetical protein
MLTSLEISACDFQMYRFPFALQESVTHPVARLVASRLSPTMGVHTAPVANPSPRLLVFRDELSQFAHVATFVE